MAIKLGRYAKVVALLFTDSMDIIKSATENDEDDNSVIVFTVGIAPAITDISCRISFHGKDNPIPSKGSDLNPANLPTTVFAGPRIDIQKGNRLTLRRLDDDGTVLGTYEGLAGMPVRYPTHIEVPLTDVSLA